MIENVLATVTFACDIVLITSGSVHLNSHKAFIFNTHDKIAG